MPAGTVIKVYNASNTLLATTTVQSNSSWTTSGATFSNGFTGNAVASTTYYATATSGTCVSANSANASTGSGVTASSSCGTITSPAAGTITSATTSINVNYSNATRVTLYEDGQSVLSQTVTSGTTSVNFDVTNRLYAGNGTNTGILTIGVQGSGLEEFTCPSTYTVLPSNCTAPASINVSPSGNITVSSGSAITFTVSNPEADAFYAVSDLTTGSSLVTGVWASTPAQSSISLTTIPFSSSTTAVVKASKLNNLGEVCSTTAQTFIVLPVHLLEFKGKRENGSVLLNWIIESEIDFSRYEIERSSNGASFSKIGEKMALNTSGRTSYIFRDAQPLQGIAYYRLRMVDIDGTFTFSNVIALSSTGSNINLQTIRPNPFYNELAVSLSLIKSQMVKLSLVDANGRCIKTQTINGTKGVNEIRYTDLAHLPAGIYMLVVSSEEGMIKQKLLKAAK
jgi:hypothetical protein